MTNIRNKNESEAKTVSVSSTEKVTELLAQTKRKTFIKVAPLQQLCMKPEFLHNSCNL